MPRSTTVLTGGGVDLREREREVEREREREREKCRDQLLYLRVEV